jgi:hypothetical protein
MAGHPLDHARAFIQLFELERLNTTLTKAEEAYAALAPETIDYCKCLIECICKHVLDEKGEEAPAGIKLPGLIKSALAVSGMKNEQVLGNFSGLVGGLAEIRNATGVAGHGVHGTVPLPTSSDIEIFASMVSGLFGVLWHLHSGERIDIARTGLTFQAVERRLRLEAINDMIDADVTVEPSVEDALVFLDGKEVRPSELLFHFDREAYAEKIKKFSVTMPQEDNQPPSVPSSLSVPQ